MKTVTFSSHWERTHFSSFSVSPSEKENKVEIGLHLEGVYFPRAAVRNYRQHCGLNDTNLLSYNYGGHKSDMGVTGLKSRCQQGSVRFWGLQGVGCFLAFLASRDCAFPGSRPFSYIFIAHNVGLNPSHAVICFSLLLPYFSIKNSCDCTWIIQNNPSILRSTDK